MVIRNKLDLDGPVVDGDKSEENKSVLSAFAVLKILPLIVAALFPNIYLSL